jgi:crotonobetainyl-CoA:carnitine CoA-transferase CaiB-like acyl-CoA transferase
VPLPDSHGVTGGPRPLQAPLGGIRVLEAGRRVPTGLAGRYLRLLGADVTKVELGDGDPSRWYGPYPPGRAGDPDASGLHVYLHTGKTVVAVRGAGASLSDRLLALAADAALVITDDSAWPDAVEAVEGAAGHTAVTVVLTDDITGDITGGRRPSRPLTRFHRGGEASLLPAGEADPARPPVRAGVLAGELQAGAALAAVALMHLYAHLVHGAAGVVRFSQVEYSISLNKGFISFPLAASVHVDRAEQGLPLRGVHRCLDGYLTVLTSEQHHWAAFARLLGRDEWAQWRLAERTAHEAEIVEAIGEWTAPQRKWDAYARCAAEGVPAAPVVAPAELIDTGYFANRGFWELVDGLGPGVRVPRLAFAVEPAPSGPGPAEASAGTGRPGPEPSRGGAEPGEPLP